MEDVESPESVSSVFSCAVQIVTGNVVSSDSMVSRAYLTDAWRAVVVVDELGGFWIAATLDALVPDRVSLFARSEQEGGPPARYARIALVKLTVLWSDVNGGEGEGSEMHIANPVVVQHPDGGPVAVVPLTATSAVARAVRAGTGPNPILMTDITSVSESCPRFDDEVYVETVFRADDGSEWLLSRRSRIASNRDGGFLGEPGGVALDLALEPRDTGSPAFSVEGSGAFRGLVRPVGDTVSMLVSSHLIAETIAHTRTIDR